MPLFDLVCKFCLEEKKDVMKRSDAAVSCPLCGNVMSPKVAHTSFKLKGKGWAKDGYK